MYQNFGYHTSVHIYIGFKLQLHKQVSALHGGVFNISELNRVIFDKVYELDTLFSVVKYRGAF